MRSMKMVVVAFAILGYSDDVSSASSMYLADSDHIKRANRDGSGTEVLVNLTPNDAMGLALDHSAGKMYWTLRVTPGQDKIQRSNLDGTSVEDLILLADVSPAGIALDLSGNRVYWVETGTAKIRRANLDGSAVQDVVTGLGSPWGIAVDAVEEKVYWTDPQGCPYTCGNAVIQRANLDGTSIETLVTSADDPLLQEPKSIVLDMFGNKMFWADQTGRTIRRANQDGRAILEVLVTADPGALALDVESAKLYYSTSKDVYRAHMDGSNLEDVSPTVSSVNAIALDPLSLPTCTITQPSSNHGQGAIAPDGVGQSFTACGSGAIESIQIYVLTTDVSDATLQLQQGMDTWNPVLTQAVALNTGENTITLQNPFPVTNGDVYSFGLLPSSGLLSLWSINDGTALPGGEPFFIVGSNIILMAPADLKCQIEIVSAPDIWVRSIEVTQAIQNAEHTVSLVAQRSTAVRVDVGIGGSTEPVPGVTGRLHVFVDGSEVTPAGGVLPINAPMTVPLIPYRDNEDDLLNFELLAPTGIPFSTDVDFRVVLDPVPGEVNLTNNVGERSDLAFFERNVPQLYFTRVDYTPAGLPLTLPESIAPGEGDAAVRGVFPVNDAAATLYCEAPFPTITFDYDPNDNGIIDISEVSELNNLLMSCRQLLVTPPPYLYRANIFLNGWVNTRTLLDGQAIRGAGREPGFVTWVSDTDYYLGTYAHELAHNFDLKHSELHIDEVGWDLGRRSSGSPAYPRVRWWTWYYAILGELMNIGAHRWIGTDNYEFLFSALPPIPRRVGSPRVLVVHGIFDSLGTTLVRLDPPFRYPWLSDSTPARMQFGPYAAEAIDDLGQAYTMHFNPLVSTDAEVEIEAFGSFEVMIAVPPEREVQSVRIYDVQSGVPYGGFAQPSQPPQIQVLAPASGSLLDSTTAVRWSLTDPDTPPESMMFQVAYSPDGSSWVPVGVNIGGTQTGISFNSTEIQEAGVDSTSGTGRGMIRVFVSDGLNTVFDDVGQLRTSTAGFPPVGSAPVPVPEFAYSSSEREIKVRFNVALDPITAQAPSNYSLSTFETIVAVAYDVHTRTVTLTSMSDLVPSSTPHVLAMSGIRNAENRIMEGINTIAFIGGISSIPFIQDPISATNDTSQVSDHRVSFRGVVTAAADNVDFPSTAGQFYVQDRNATDYAGIVVVDSPMMPSRGDSVFVSGLVLESGAGRETQIASVAEIRILASDVSPIPPINRTLAQISGSDLTEAEKYESSLVRVQTVKVISSGFPGAPFYVEQGTAVKDTLRIDDLAVDEGTYQSLFGDSLDVTGVIAFSASAPLRRLQPRNWNEPPAGDIHVVYKSQVSDTPPGTFRTRLEQNHPNPFNAATEIRFVVGHAGRTTLRIYDVRGRLIVTLLDRELEAGFVSVPWKGTDFKGRRLGSGVYLCRLITSDAEATRKMVLLR